MAQFGDNTADLEAILKELYPDGLPLDSAYKTSRLLGMCPKMQLEGAGIHHKIPVQIGNVGSVSATFANAIGANQTAAKFRAFEVGIVPHYAGAGVTGLAIAEAKGNKAAFKNAVESTVESALYAMGRKNSQMIYGNGNGKAGTLQADPGVAVGPNPVNRVLTVSHREARNFEVGQFVSIGTNATPSVARAGGPFEITAIDRNASLTTAYLYLGTAVDASVIATDIVVRAGDLNVCMLGLESWIPTDRTGLATPFQGVDRSVDPERLAGVSADLTTIPSSLDQLVRALRMMADAGAMTSHLLCSPTFFEEISNTLSVRDKAERMVVKSFDGVHGYSALKVVGGGSGEVSVVMDPDCPDNRLYALELDTWAIKHVGGLPFIDDRDGTKWLRSAGSDGMDLRIVQYANLICKAPAKNGSFVV